MHLKFFQTQFRLFPITPILSNSYSPHKYQVISLHQRMVTCGLKPCINTILADTDKLIIKKCKGVVNNPRLVPS